MSRIGKFLLVALVAVTGLGVMGMNQVMFTGEEIAFEQQTPMQYDQNNYYMNTKNPLVAADPWIIATDDGYYAYATSDKLSGYGFLAWHSSDLVNWQEVGTVYYMNKETWGKRDFWAPEVTAYQDKYYLHYTAKDADNEIKIGMAVADTPTGPFIDLSDQPFFDPGYNVIDSNILIDGDKMYLYYSRDCSEHIYEGRHESHIYGVELQDMTTIIGEPQLMTQPELAWETVSGDYRWNEGPEVLKHEEQYYLVYSANFYDSREYALGYAVADHPLGPYTKLADNQILYAEADWDHVSGTGHNSFAFSPDESEQYVVYHSHINPMGGGVRQLNLDKMGFRSDGTIYMNGPSVTPQPLPSGAGSLQRYQPQIITVNDEAIPASVLSDGEVVYHQAQDANSQSFTGQTAVTLTFEQSVTLSEALIYAYESEIQLQGIQLNPETYLPAQKFKAEFPGEALILSFKPVQTTEVTFVFEGKQPYSLSELQLFGPAA